MKTKSIKANPTGLSLDIGAGPNGRGNINVDIRVVPGIDVVCDARWLPFASDSLGYVSLHHVLEHFSYPDALEILRQVSRILKPSGLVEIRMPCFQSTGVLYAWVFGTIDYYNREYPSVFAPLTGLQDYKENVHMSQWSFKLARMYVEKVGLRVVVLDAPDKYGGQYVFLNILLLPFPSRRGTIRVLAEKVL